MAAPLYVNAGTNTGTAFGTSVAPTRPGSRVNGNVLLAICSLDAAGVSKTVTVSGTGWVLLDSQGSTGVSSAFAYCIITGSEADPTFSWTGNTSARAQVFQYSGVTASPIGSEHKTVTVTSATVTETGVTTTANNSLVVVLVGGYTTTTTMGAATNYTQDSAAAGGTGGTISAYSETKATLASASDAFSITAGAAAGYAAYSVELRSELVIIWHIIAAGVTAAFANAFTISGITKRFVAAQTLPMFTQTLSFNPARHLVSAKAVPMFDQLMGFATVRGVVQAKLLPAFTQSFRINIVGLRASQIVNFCSLSQMTARHGAGGRRPTGDVIIEARPRQAR